MQQLCVLEPADVSSSRWEAGENPASFFIPKKAAILISQPG